MKMTLGECSLCSRVQVRFEVCMTRRYTNTGIAAPCRSGLRGQIQVMGDLPTVTSGDENVARVSGAADALHLVQGQTSRQGISPYFKGVFY